MARTQELAYTVLARRHVVLATAMLRLQRPAGTFEDLWDSW